LADIAMEAVITGFDRVTIREGYRNNPAPLAVPGWDRNIPKVSTGSFPAIVSAIPMCRYGRMPTARLREVSP